MNDENEEIILFECLNCKKIFDESELYFNAPANCPGCGKTYFKIYANLNEYLEDEKE